MRLLLTLLKWDLLLLLRYNVMSIALALGSIYFLVILLIEIPDLPVIFMIYSDPAMLGFIFIGVMVLFEKQSETLTVLKITPVEPWQYLMSKLIALTLPALVIGMAMGIAARIDNLLLLAAAIIMASSLMLLLGFAGVVRVKTFNQYILVIPLFLAPLSLPLISFFSLVQTPFMWLIPTHSMLILFRATIMPVSTVELAIALPVALLMNFAAWKFALGSYRRYIIEE
jgi:fluoroquinolone transport system permease protein